LWKPGSGAVVCSEHFHPSDFFWQWGRKLIKKDSEPTVFSFASATSRKPPMNRNLTQSVGHSVEQVSSMDLSASCQPELPVSVDSSKLMDDHQYCLKSPKKLSRQVSELTKKLHDKTAALRNARKRERRLHGRVEDLLKRLKNMQLLNEQAEELLEVFKHMPLNLLSGKAGTCFTQDQKQFAITLYYYSPAAYQYVRRRFNLLPSPRTIRNWLSSFEGSPGLTQQSFDTICEKIQRNDDDSWSYKLCSLHVDEMEIKKQLEVERSSGMVYGFTDIGSGTDYIDILYCKLSVLFLLFRI